MTIISGDALVRIFEYLILDMKVESGACAYVVTAYKSTAVTHSVVGNFTDKDDLNLIVAKHTRIGRRSENFGYFLIAKGSFL